MTKIDADNNRKKIVVDSVSEEYEGLVRNLKGSIERNHISFIDSYAYEIMVFLQEHPGFVSEEEVEEKMEALEAIIAAAWKAPGWEEIVARLSISKLNTREIQVL